MTPAEVKKTRLYRTLAPCIVKKDREELARMLAMVGEESINPYHRGLESGRLWMAFSFLRSPQGGVYWMTLSDRLRNAGHNCY